MRLSIILIPFQYSAWNIEMKQRGSKKSKNYKLGKKEVKPFLFIGDIFLTCDILKKNLEMTNKFSKVARYKINLQRSFIHHQQAYWQRTQKHTLIH